MLKSEDTSLLIEKYALDVSFEGIMKSTQSDGVTHLLKGKYIVSN